MIFQAHTQVNNSDNNPTTQFCDFRFYGVADDVMTMTGYSYLNAQDLLNENIKMQLYSQYNAQHGLYPLASFQSYSCCLGVQNENELGYGELAHFMLVASLDETNVATSSPCTTNYKTDKLYELFIGPHPATLQQSLNINVTMIDIGDICSGYSQPNFVMKCNSTPIAYNAWSDWILSNKDVDSPTNVVWIPLTNGHAVIESFYVYDNSDSGIVNFGIESSTTGHNIHGDEKKLFVGSEIKAIQVREMKVQLSITKSHYTIANIRLQKIDGSWTTWINDRQGDEYTISALKGTIKAIQGKATKDWGITNIRFYEIDTLTVNPTIHPTLFTNVPTIHSTLFTHNPTIYPTIFTNVPSVSQTQLPTITPNPQILFMNVLSWPWYIWLIIAVAILFILFSFCVICKMWCDLKRIQTLNISNPKVIFIPIGKYDIDKNMNFENLDENGIAADNEQIHNLFVNKLQYNVECKHSLDNNNNETLETCWKQDELRDFLQNQAEILKENQTSKVCKKFDGLIVILTCHGMKDNIITSDGKQIRKEQIHRWFSVNYPESRTIPRIFLYDCCDGNLSQKGIKPKKQTSNGTGQTTVITSGDQGKTTIIISDEKSDENILKRNEKPPDYQLVTIYSSSIGYKSYMNRHEGSYMIHKFVQETLKQLNGNDTPYLYQILGAIQKELPKKGQHPTFTCNDGTAWIKFLRGREGKKDQRKKPNDYVVLQTS